MRLIDACTGDDFCTDNEEAMDGIVQYYNNGVRFQKFHQLGEFCGWFFTSLYAQMSWKTSRIRQIERRIETERQPEREREREREGEKKRQIKAA